MNNSVGVLCNLLQIVMLTQCPVNTGATRLSFNRDSFMQSPEFLRRLGPILKTIEATPAIKDVDFDRNPLTGNVGTTVARSRKIIPLLQALRLNRREIDKVYPDCIRLAVVGILELRIQRRMVTDRQIDKFPLGYRVNSEGKLQPVLLLSNEDKRLLNRWAVLTKMPGAAQVWTSEQFNSVYWESIILKIDSLPKRSVTEVPKGDPRIVTVQSRRPALVSMGALALWGLGVLAVSQCAMGDSSPASSDRAGGDIIDPRMLEPTFTDMRPLSEIFVGGPTSAKTKFAQDIVTRVDHEMKKIESLFVDKETFRQMVLGDTRLTEFNDGHPFTGSGKVVRLGGVREEGRFVDGRLHGNGTRIDAQGFQFIGPFYNGKQRGKGHLYTAGGATVFGEFDGPNLNGFGRYIIAADDYQGEFLNNMKSGIGVNRVGNTPFWFVGISANNEFVRGERYHRGWSSGTYSQVEKDGKGVWMLQGKGEIHYTRLNALLSALKDGKYDEDSAPDMALLNLHFGFFMEMLNIQNPLAFDSDEPAHWSRHIESVCRLRHDNHFQTDATVFLYRAHEDHHLFYQTQDRRRLGFRKLSRDHIEFQDDAIQTSKRLAIARNLHVVTLTSDKVTLLIDYLEKWGREVPVRTGGSHGRLQVPFAMPSELQATRQFIDVFLALQLFANY